MSKLYFKYSTMNAGKSLNLISTAYSFKERSIPYIVMKPVIDTRDSGFIKSRALSTQNFRVRTLRRKLIFICL
jgi:thymidine kinase